MGRGQAQVYWQYVTPSDVQSSSDEIRAFLQGPDLAHMAQSEHSLVRGSNCSMSLAHIWAAMAMFEGSQDRRMRDVPHQEQDELECFGQPLWDYASGSI